LGCDISRNYNGFAASTPEKDRVTLECNHRCGIINNVDTGWSYDARTIEGMLMNEVVNTVVLDPGRYDVELLSHGKMVPWDVITYDTRRFEPVPGHRYNVDKLTDTTPSITDETTGEVVVKGMPTSY
jgi:hypothetical protein